MLQEHRSVLRHGLAVANPGVTRDTHVALQKLLAWSRLAGDQLALRILQIRARRHRGGHAHRRAPRRNVRSRNNEDRLHKTFTE
eukprot:356189-Chlamydomonas_euryale.AAC.5